MSFHTIGPRRGAALAAALLVTFGAVLGITLDRLWLGRAPVAAAATLTPTPLTLDAMAEALDLDSAARARLGTRLDSLGEHLARATAQGPDSLRAAARHAREQVEAALPADRRQPFRRWMDGHRDRMIQMMRGGRTEPMRHSGMQRTGIHDSVAPDSETSRPGRMRGRGRGRGRSPR